MCVSAPDQEHAFETASPRVPEVQGVPSRMIEEELDEASKLLQVPDEQGDRTRGLDQHLAKRKDIGRPQRAFHDIVDRGYRLIGEALQPQNAGEEAPGHRALVED